MHVTKMLMAFFLAVCLSFPLTACNEEDVVLNTYKSLETSAVTYDTIMRAASEMRKEGALSPEKWAEVKSAAQIFYDAYQAAVVALNVYVEAREHTQTPDTSILMSAVTYCSVTLEKLVERAYQLGVTIKDTVGDTDG